MRDTDSLPLTGRGVSLSSSRSCPVKKLLLCLLCALLISPARAASYPDLISIGVGGYNFDKVGWKQSVDYRVDYRFGLSLLPLLSHRFDTVDPYVRIHPAIGFEGNTKGMAYGNAGLNVDVPFLKHGIFTWGEAIGVYESGNDPRSLGSALEFRSQLEIGWRFANNMRVTAFFSHISNLSVIEDNPGAEILGLYFHIPTTLFGAK